MFYLVKDKTEYVCVQIHFCLHPSSFISTHLDRGKATSIALSFIQYVKQFMHFSNYVLFKTNIAYTSTTVLENRHFSNRL